MSVFDRLMDLQKQINSQQRLINQLLTIEKPRSSGDNGWIQVVDGLWSYASANTLNVPSGAASIYAVGDQVRLKQGGAYKYFNIIDIADTLLTITGGSDYGVANAAITDAAFSKGGGVGHPGWFNYNSITDSDTGTAGTYAETKTVGQFTIVNSLVVYVIAYKVIANKGSWTGKVRTPLPTNLLPKAEMRFGGAVMGRSTLYPIYAIGTSFAGYSRIDMLKSGTFLNWSDVTVGDVISIRIFYDF